MTIGIVGRLVPVKDHKMFLDAASRFLHLPSFLPPRFWIIGDGELRNDLRRYAGSLGLDGAVQFLGWRRDLPSVYRELDIVVLTSRNEGSPVSLIEAMAAARPVVATDVGGVRELLTGDEGRGTKEEGRRRKEEKGVVLSSLLPPSSPPLFEVLAHGLLVPPGSAEALAAALERLMADAPLRQTLGQAGRRFVAGRYRLERLVGDIERLYDDLLGVEPRLSAISDQSSAGHSLIAER